MRLILSILTAWLALAGVALGQGSFPTIGSMPNLVGRSNFLSYASATNTVYLRNGGTNNVDGTYQWSGAAYTNGGGIGGYYSSGDGAWIFTNASHHNGVSDYVVALEALPLYPSHGLWVDGTGSTIAGLVGLYSTNTTTTAAANVTGYFRGDGSGLTNVDKFVLPLATSNAVVAQSWGTNTAWVDNVNGNDGTAVLGNPNLPSATITNAYRLMPDGGVIWMKPGTSNIIQQAQLWGRNGTVVAFGASIVALGANTGDGFFNVQSNNLEVWGGNWDSYTYSCLNYPFGILNSKIAQLTLHYINLTAIPDFVKLQGSAANQAYAEFCKFSSTWDGFTLSSSASSLVEINDCLLVCNSIGPDGMTFTTQLRPIATQNGSAAGYVRVKNSDIIAINGPGEECPVCFDSGTLGNVYLENCRLVSGSHGTNTTLIWSGGGSGTLTLANMQVQTNRISLGGGTVAVAYLGTNSTYLFNGNGSGITNIPIGNINMSLAASLVTLTNGVVTNVTLDFPATTTLTASDLLVNIANLKSNDTITVNAPFLTLTNTGFYTAFISNTTAYARFYNYKGTTVDPPSGSFIVEVRQYK